MVCGFGESASYETLVRSWRGAQIDKSPRFTDWARAAADRAAARLRAGRRHPSAQCLRGARQAADDQRTRALAGGGDGGAARPGHLPARPRRGLAPPEAARRSKPRLLAVLREVAAWREREAQRRDIPRNRVILRDEALLEIAAQRAGTSSRLWRGCAACRKASPRAGWARICSSRGRSAALGHAGGASPQRCRPPPATPPRHRPDRRAAQSAAQDEMRGSQQVAQKLVAIEPDLERDRRRRRCRRAGAARLAARDLRRRRACAQARPPRPHHEGQAHRHHAA